MRPIFLSNDWDIHRVDVKSRGVLVTGIAPRGFLSLTPDGAAIHASLEIVLTELAPGDFIGTIQGDALRTHLAALWVAADATGEPLVIYERVVVDTEDYGDQFPLQVERDRPVKAVR